MSAFLKKRFTKWSMISILGIVAYFLGFSFGADELNDQIIAQFESEKLENASMPDMTKQNDAQKLARNDHPHAHNTLIFLPGSQQAADLSQLK